MKPSQQKNEFFQNVYDVVRLIPRGRVTSYGAIANYLGSPRSSRMVGWAMNRCGKFTDIPAHRVVNRNGLLTGKAHFHPHSSMEERLRAEGIHVVDHKIVHFQTVFWNPSTELKL